MIRPRKRWDFYVVQQQRGELAYRLVGSTVHLWPTTRFEEAAREQGFDRLVCDGTLIGGYYVDGAGNRLVCVPHKKDPATIKPL